MIENINGVKNPLTIIAIFAGLAEVSGTGILPFIAEGNQSTYIWFLMLFPIFLVSIFFVTLNFNPRVLYAPSDFRDEENYMKLFRPSSATQKIQKMKEEIEEIKKTEDTEQLQPKRHDRPEKTKIIANKGELQNLLRNDPRTLYTLAEDVVITELEKEFKTPSRRSMSLINKYGSQIFDAVFENRDGLILVEVKLLSKSMHLRRIRDTIKRIEASIQALPLRARRNTKAILAVAYHDIPEGKLSKIHQELESIINDFSFPIELRMFSIDEIVQEIESISEQSN